LSPLPQLHIVTDDAVLASKAFHDVAERVLERCGPAAALHVRGPATSGAKLYAIAAQLRTFALRSRAWLLVNDRVDIALAVRANGVQLGARSLEVRDARALLGDGATIGCSVHDAAAALRAERDGADFLMLGTIYESASHAGHAAAGTALVRETAERTALDVIAIGGITPERIAAVAAAGAHGVAVLGGVWRTDDPAQAAAAYMEAAHDAWPTR
jgi:thiamine-phosphate diphosphorylase